MLWDLIRDFFVQHVFGGTMSNGDNVFISLGEFTDGFDSGQPLFKIGVFFNSNDEIVPLYTGLGDWLSTTATIISITIIVVLCCLFVYKIIKLIGGLIR